MAGRPPLLGETIGLEGTLDVRIRCQPRTISGFTISNGLRQTLTADLAESKSAFGVAQARIRQGQLSVQARYACAQPARCRNAPTPCNAGSLPKAGRWL